VVGPSPLDGKDKKDKVCAFYLTPRGCIKGDKCDFQHPDAGVAVTTPQPKVCDFYLTSRGCRKGDQCDFLHPQARPPVKNKVCTFYMTPQGCIKGLNCDFLHPRPGVYGDMGGMDPSAGLAGQLPEGFEAWAQLYPELAMQYQAQLAAAGVGGFPGVGVGGFPTGGAGVGVPKKKPKLCEFFKTPRGCVKGDTCDFIHQKDKVCDFFSKPGGCRKGELCDFQHPGAKEGEAAGGLDAAAGIAAAAAAAAAAGAAGGGEADGSDPGKITRGRAAGSRFAPY